MAVAASPIAASAILPAQLSRLRHNRGWTLAELAQRTGLSRPYLSRLEGGLRQPSLAALISLAGTYETPLQALLDPAAAGASAESTVIRGTRATIQRGNGLRYRPISGGKDALRLSALHVTVPLGRRHRTFSQHEGEELLYVLSGTLVLTLDRQSHTLGAGDSAHFDSKIPHRLTAGADRDAEVLLVSCASPLADHRELHPANARKRTARPANDRNGVPTQLCAALPADANFGRNLAKS
jgi:transcriptional regulator with XRE-family HTH domain/uncharacterized cupin superfamily protein